MRDCDSIMVRIGIGGWVVVALVASLILGCVGCSSLSPGEARRAELADNDGVGLMARSAVKPEAATSFQSAAGVSEAEASGLWKPTPVQISGPVDAAALSVALTPPVAPLPSVDAAEVWSNIAKPAPTAPQVCKNRQESARQAATSTAPPVARFVPQGRALFPRVRRLFNR